MRDKHFEYGEAHAFFQRKPKVKLLTIIFFLFLQLLNLLCCTIFIFSISLYIFVNFL